MAKFEPVKADVAKPIRAKVEPVKVEPKGKVINNTKTHYQIAVPGEGTYLIKPGINEVPSQDLAKALVLDLNKSVPGDDNNPFEVG